MSTAADRTAAATERLAAAAERIEELLRPLPDEQAAANVEDVPVGFSPGWGRLYPQTVDISVALEDGRGTFRLPVTDIGRVNLGALTEEINQLIEAWLQEENEDTGEQFSLDLTSAVRAFIERGAS